MHIPVLVKEVLDHLDPKPGENFIDCTVGQGGHAREILKKTGSGKLLGLDQDPEQIEICKESLKEFEGRITLINSSYTKLKEIIQSHNFRPINGILLDLGMSSRHIDESGRGFSFKRDEPLDMRYNPDDPEIVKAEEIINDWPEKEIEEVLREYGQERFSKRIAGEIVFQRKKGRIENTFQLVELVKKAIPTRFQHGKVHFATRTFQALRIAVNQELENIKKVLPQSLEILEKGGRLTVISFHSLEDRIVKNFFKDSAKENTLKILTKKPISSSFEEQAQNPRARSAKLRAIIKI